MSNHCEKGPVVRTTPRFALADGRSAVALCGCGTFAEAMVVDEASVVAVETDLPDEELALLGCGVTTGLGAALNTAGVAPGLERRGDRVRRRRPVGHPGCPHLRRVDDRRDRPGSRTPGGQPRGSAPRTPSTRPAADPVEQVMALTRGRGADYSFEVVGQPELIVQAFDMARPEGTVVLVGMPALDATFTLPALAAVFSGKRLMGSVVGGSQILRDFPRFIQLAESGRLDLGSLVSKRIGLDEINDGLDTLTRAEGVRTVIV